MFDKLKAIATDKTAARGAAITPVVVLAAAAVAVKVLRGRTVDTPSEDN